MAIAGTIPAYEEMLCTLFPQNQQSGKGQVVAFTSANPGEGVTYIVDALATQLVRHPLDMIACIDARRLRELDATPEEIVQMCQPTRQKNIFRLPPPKLKSRGTDLTRMLHGSSYHRQQLIEQLRLSFNYVLIDCPSLRAAGDVLRLAPLIDGIVLVVEANRTKKEHVQNAERRIEAANGRILGNILNKRTYVVPAWLYSRL